MTNNGWVKFHRKILDNDFLNNDPSACLIFMKLLVLADKKGHLTTGRYALARFTGLKPVTQYKALKRLEKAKMVTQASNTRFTEISICNWGKYQTGGTRDGNTTSNTTSNNGGNTLQEYNTENKNKNNTIVLAKAEFGKTEVNDMFAYWQETTGLSINSKIQANRNACNNLIKRHGVDKLHRIVQGVAAAQGDQYAPRIANFIQLQSKTDELILWGKQRVNLRKVVKI